MAIQISGTTVVNDSRELQNIASLDSTTTSTIQAASSSAMTLVTEGSITSNVSYLDLTLNNHERTIAYDGSPEGNSSNPSSTVNYQIWHDNTARQINGLRFFCTNGAHSLTTGKYQVLGIN